MDQLRNQKHKKEHTEREYLKSIQKNKILK